MALAPPKPKASFARPFAPERWQSHLSVKQGAGKASRLVWSALLTKSSGGGPSALAVGFAHLGGPTVAKPPPWPPRGLWPLGPFGAWPLRGQVATPPWLEAFGLKWAFGPQVAFQATCQGDALAPPRPRQRGRAPLAVLKKPKKQNDNWLRQFSILFCRRIGSFASSPPRDLFPSHNYLLGISLKVASPPFGQCSLANNYARFTFTSDFTRFASQSSNSTATKASPWMACGCLLEIPTGLWASPKHLPFAGNVP